MRRCWFVLAAIGLSGCADLEEFLIPDDYGHVYSYQPDMMTPTPRQACPAATTQAAPILPTSYSAPTREPELANPGRR